MKALFVDTAGWMACADAADPAHARACGARDMALESGQSLVTSDYVVDETLTLVRMRLGLAAAEDWWAQVQGSARLSLEWVNPVRADRARHIFFRHRDKTFSFTDCTSFAIMQELKLKQALTTDKHFLQVGFETLPGPQPKRMRVK